MASSHRVSHATVDEVHSTSTSAASRPSPNALPPRARSEPPGVSLSNPGIPHPMAPSTSTNGSRRCSTSCISASSPSPAPASPTTTPSSRLQKRRRRAQTPRIRDHIPQRFSARVNAFRMTCYRRSSTTIDPACSPPCSATTKGKSKNATATRTSPPPMRSSNPSPMPRRSIKPGVTFQQLDAIAYARRDLDAARAVNAARDELFANHRLQCAAAFFAATPPARAIASSSHSTVWPSLRTTPQLLQWPPAHASSAGRPCAASTAEPAHRQRSR